MPRILGITFLLCFISILGCGESGPKRNAVSGKVTYKGEPIKLGTISFRSPEGYVGTVEIKDGEYAIVREVGLPAASYQVAISYPDPKVPAPRPDEPPGESAPVREMLPAKYNDKSELKVDIVDGSNDSVNFDLK
jgi:hypothetical protein